MKVRVKKKLLWFLFENFIPVIINFFMNLRWDLWINDFIFWKFVLYTAEILLSGVCNCERGKKWAHRLLCQFIALINEIFFDSVSFLYVILYRLLKKLCWLIPNESADILFLTQTKFFNFVAAFDNFYWSMMHQIQCVFSLTFYRCA